MPTARRLAAVSLVLAALVIGSGACSAKPTGDAGPGPTSSAPATTTPPAAATTTKPPTTYPATAQAYAQLVLTAWSQLQVQTLGDLTTPDAQAQILAITAPPNQPWTAQQCDGAAGSTYCSFASTDGDLITLRITNELLGKPHAATEAKFDPTVYATDAKEYVRSFIDAWRNVNTRRMVALASQAEVDYFTHYTPPDTYTVCGLKSGDVWQVRIYNAAGLNYLVKVTDSALGGRHAIAAHVDPPVGPPVCS